MPLFGMAGCCCGPPPPPDPDGENCCLEWPVRVQLTGVNIVFEDEFEICDETIVTQLDGILGDEYILDSVSKPSEGVCRFTLSGGYYFYGDGVSINLSFVLDLSDFYDGVYHAGELKTTVSYNTSGGSSGNSIYFLLDGTLTCDGAATLVHDDSRSGSSACFDFDLSSPSADIEFIVP